MNPLRKPGWLHLPGSWLKGTFAPQEPAAAPPKSDEPPRIELRPADEEDEFEGEAWSFWPRSGRR